MANQIALNVNIEEVVGHLGIVNVDEEHLKAWMAEYEYPELTMAVLREYLSDAGLEMREKYTDIKDSTWSALSFEDPTVTDIKIAAEPVEPPAPTIPDDEIARFYWDHPDDGDDPCKPYGEETARIIDLAQGGVIAYTHENSAPGMVAALTAAAEQVTV